MSALFTKHQDLLSKALDACSHRYAWSGWPENPSSKIHGDEKPAAGLARFEALLGQDFPLVQPGEVARVGEEVSPYTGEPLGVRYPRADPEVLFTAINSARPAWAAATPEARVGVCLEILQRCGEQLFENAHATMHTSGQSYVMAFAGSGANALDRGLEALAYAHKAMQDVPATAHWERKFGRDGVASLHKRYRLVPRGIGVVICCATFPLWNTYPALCASLATGNPVVLKPHPAATLPVALVARVCREVLAEAGYDPNLVTLAADTRAEPATLPLIQHPDTAIIDFTGSPRFGSWLEQNCPGKQVYTETAGCNSVVLESTDDLQATARAVAHSLCQASAQMCTSVQNIHVPAAGVRVAGEWVPHAEVAAAICRAVDGWLADPRAAATLCGTLFDPAVQSNVDRYRQLAAAQQRILRDSAPYENPGFPAARTATPLVIAASEDDRDWYREEVFGPVSFLIANADAEACLRDATGNARDCGAITSHVYSTDAEFLARAVDAYHAAGASVACNLTGMPINFAAAYSDFHVTGLNPAGNACLADLAFVSNRFRIVQSKFMGVAPASA
ncbi:MAG: phenylacetic acid degradation protein PaaN [Halieaceae bacterium]|jgi:phenylacetic acid degradation protein paaN|uniref:phenylacetic acid degradation protein PaaN n=1 Tax=Haliea alexandrii TaxID=2448162 RepID=UPI000F0BD999|nr:phenylacetic acid degradation protein PaaN [Haliea alexandrii]MCR9185717.1 phenylacetic acid degradation protein PaaN [Halieaceae bacterium]